MRNERDAEDLKQLRSQQTQYIIHNNRNILANITTNLVLNKPVVSCIYLLLQSFWKDINHFCHFLAFGDVSSGF